MNENKKLWAQRRRRMSEIVEAGAADDFVSRTYDVVSTLILLINVAVTILYTFDKIGRAHV